MINCGNYGPALLCQALYHRKCITRWAATSEYASVCLDCNMPFQQVAKRACLRARATRSDGNQTTVFIPAPGLTQAQHNSTIFAKLTIEDASSRCGFVSLFIFFIAVIFVISIF